ncbi:MULTISPECIES: hypothetical protein [Leptospira]|uniref:Lipoprotein n=1 Tax=Leptospira jelokensis TaxID=2484931 RepID=A0A4Z1A3H2_9LEPT|nr:MULTISPECIES: hypothetical protein [Leptospira]MCW7472188.1 hypothetical protein [Leptospira levettii]TGL65938.1 hypothetical protein EHQ62_09920 [Leptospira jelokensis]TGL99666.1 hypothetical protein EHQ79_17985 [Leptospira jelokensis]TGM80506.1 hypothetical protein EHQ99_12615 [Leptospira bouyouniensis]
MGSVSAKILVVFSLISATMLASSCNLFCELNYLDKIATSLQLDVEPCHNSEGADDSKSCEWDSGTLDLTQKDKFKNFSIFFSLLQYYTVSFIKQDINQRKGFPAFVCFKVFFHIPSDTIISINSIRIII